MARPEPGRRLVQLADAGQVEPDAFRGRAASFQQNRGAGVLRVAQRVDGRVPGVAIEQRPDAIQLFLLGLRLAAVPLVAVALFVFRHATIGLEPHLAQEHAVGAARRQEPSYLVRVLLAARHDAIDVPRDDGGRVARRFCVDELLEFTRGALPAEEALHCRLRAGCL